jgi:hypothetical protein
LDDHKESLRIQGTKKGRIPYQEKRPFVITSDGHRVPTLYRSANLPEPDEEGKAEK